MQPSIQKEKAKKSEQKAYIIVAVVAVIYCFLVYMEATGYVASHPRVNILEAISMCATVIPNIAYIFETTGKSLVMFIVIAMVGGAFAMTAVIERNLKKHDNPDTVNGEAHFMTLEELARFNKKRTDPYMQPSNDGEGNMILSRDIKLGLEGTKTRRNCNVLVIGGSGAGKSRFFAAPNILEYNAGFVVTDPSGELLNDYGKALENNGYTVKVFNLVDVYRGNRYNPFHYIKEEKDVYVLVNTLIKNTTPADAHSGDPFWEKSEKLLLEALILYLWHKEPEERQTFANVVKLVNMASVDENDATAESPLDILFADLEREDPGNLACEQYKTFKQGAGKTLKSILISVGSRLESFQLSDIKYLTDVDEFEFEKFADSKQALFVIIPTADTTFNFLVSMMYSQLFTSLYTYVETRADLGWQAYVDDNNIIKVLQASDENQSIEAEKQIDDFIARFKKGYKIKYNDKKKLYELYIRGAKTSDGSKPKPELVTWRGEKKALKEYAIRLQNMKKRKCPRRCPVHVRLILDEFANIGQIPDFDAKLATIRKYAISCSIILQAISQLRVLYKDKWNTIAANCDSKLFLGCDDSETIEWLLKMLGKKTTTVQSMSFQSKGGSESINKSSIELMTIDQVTMMADDECLVRIRGERPFYGKKYELEDHPNYNYAHSLQGKFKIPVAKAYEEAKQQRKPLRMRLAETKAEDAGDVKDNAAEEKASTADTPAEKTDKKSSVQKNTRDGAREAANKARKERAKEALKALDEFDDNPPQALEEDALMRTMAETLGLTPSMTSEEMSEIAETLMTLQEPPSEDFSYAQV